MKLRKNRKQSPPAGEPPAPPLLLKHLQKEGGAGGFACLFFLTFNV
jgi:hypothetical protein